MHTPPERGGVIEVPAPRRAVPFPHESIPKKTKGFVSLQLCKC